MAGDVRSRLWFTYRKNFKPISEYMLSPSPPSLPPPPPYVAGGTNITGDQGWGCTLRCGQMVMGNTLLLKHLGRGESRDHQVTVMCWLLD